MSSQTPWTPGPWTSDGTTSASKGWPIVNSQWGEVARFAYSGDDQAQANADICAIAPEMAEALRKLVLLCPSQEGLGGHAPIAAFIQLGEAARAILARLPQKGGEK